MVSNKITTLSKGDYVRSKILDYLRGHTVTHSPASIREIAEAMGLQVSTIDHHLTVMEDAGLIKREPGQARSIQILGE